MADRRLLAWLVGLTGKGRAVGVGEVKFRGDIKPDIKRVRYEVSMRQVRRGKLAVGIADGSVFADDAMRISRQGYAGRNDRVHGLRCGSRQRATPLTDGAPSGDNWHADRNKSR